MSFFIIFLIFTLLFEISKMKMQIRYLENFQIEYFNFINKELLTIIQSLQKINTVRSTGRSTGGTVRSTGGTVRSTGSTGRVNSADTVNSQVLNFNEFLNSVEF